MKMIKATALTTVVIMVFIIILIVFLYYQNSILQTTKISLKFDDLPNGFEGYRIVHLSDLHNKAFGKDNKILLSKVKRAKPDLIVITGDLINANGFNEVEIVNLMDNLKNLAPVYYITGNHEVASRGFKFLKQDLLQIGINILIDATSRIDRNGDSIFVTGLRDPIVTDEIDNSYSCKVLSEALNKLIPKNKQSNFNILLSHRPEQLKLYSQYNFDLIFAGHAHGGQIRLPFVGGLIAPNQGIFPEYTSGKYTLGNSTMIVSRGLGNSTIPIRLFNRPQIIVVTLHKDK